MQLNWKLNPHVWSVWNETDKRAWDQSKAEDYSPQGRGMNPGFCCGQLVLVTIHLWIMALFSAVLQAVLVQTSQGTPVFDLESNNSRECSVASDQAALETVSVFLLLLHLILFPESFFSMWKLKLYRIWVLNAGHMHTSSVFYTVHELYAWQPQCKMHCNNKLQI